MINKKSIIKTVKTRYSKEDECYVAESILWDNTSGTGDTPAEAFDCFITLFEMEYDDYLKGSHIKNKVGRPAKGKTRFHAEIDPDIKEAIIKMGKQYSLSQGEVVEFLFKIYQKD